MSQTNRENLLYYVETHDRYQNYRRIIEADGGDIARAYRVASRLSLRKFAASLDVSPSWWSKVERGLEVLPPEVARVLLARSGGE